MRRVTALAHAVLMCVVTCCSVTTVSCVCSVWPRLINTSISTNSHSIRSQSHTTEHSARVAQGWSVRSMCHAAASIIMASDSCGRCARLLACVDLLLVLLPLPCLVPMLPPPHLSVSCSTGMICPMRSHPSWQTICMIHSRLMTSKHATQARRTTHKK